MLFKCPNIDAGIEWKKIYLSLRFNGHFPGEPGLTGVYWSKGWWRWWLVTTGLLEL